MHEGPAVDEVIRLSALRVAWLLEPIGDPLPGAEGRAGRDLTGDPVVTRLVACFNAIPPYDPAHARWRELAEQSADILQRRCKDLGVAAYLTLAWVHERDVLGLLDGLVLLRELGKRYWYWLQPPVAKPRSRGFVFEWLTQQVASVLYRDDARADATHVEAAARVLADVDAFLADKLREHHGGAAALARSLEALRERARPPSHVAEQRLRLHDSFARRRVISDPPIAPRALAQPPQRGSELAALAAAHPQPEDRLRALLTARQQRGRASDPAAAAALDREIVTLSHQLGVLPPALPFASPQQGGAMALPSWPPSAPEPEPISPAPLGQRGQQLGDAALFRPRRRSMRGAASRHEPLPAEGVPVDTLQLVVHLRQLPERELLRALRKEVPYRLEVALEPSRDPRSLTDAELRTSELFAEAALPELCVGLEADGALLAFPDHPGSIGPRLMSDPLPCSLSAGTRSFQFDIMGTGEDGVTLDVTIWLRHEVLLRARVALPCTP